MHLWCKTTPRPETGNGRKACKAAYAWPIPTGWSPKTLRLHPPRVGTAVSDPQRQLSARTQQRIIVMDTRMQEQEKRTAQRAPCAPPPHLPNNPSGRNI